jgi:hypothetical protein
MNRLPAPGVITLVLTFIVGLWLVISPFVMKAQAVGAAWSPGTINDVAVGGVLIGVSLLGTGATLALGVCDLVRAAGQRSEHASAESAA